MIPYSKQNIDDDDLDAIIKVLKSDYLTTGPKIDEFEQKFAQYVGSKHAIAVSSGTAALHIACIAAGLQKGDEIVTTPLTFAADGNCALYCQAKPKFVDITSQGLINPEKIQEKISDKTKILIPVDYAGFPCNLKKLGEIAQNKNLVIIEDCSHALGAKYNNQRLGNGKYVDMSIFSFHPVKHITTGEGGMITTNSKELYEKLLLLRSHGITKNPQNLTTNEGPWYYEMQELGYNYRLTDFQSALGIAQLKKIDKFVQSRRAIAKIYDEEFKNSTDFSIIQEESGQDCSYHLYPILCQDKTRRKEIFESLRSQNLYVQVHYIPVYYHPYYQKIGYTKGLCPKAEDFYEREISIPLHPGMSDQDVQTVIKKIKHAFTS